MEMTIATLTFLNHLECAARKRESLPLPFVMKRIHELLGQLIMEMEETSGLPTKEVTNRPILGCKTDAEAPVLQNQSDNEEATIRRDIERPMYRHVSDTRGVTLHIVSDGAKENTYGSPLVEFTPRIIDAEEPAYVSPMHKYEHENSLENNRISRHEVEERMRRDNADPVNEFRRALRELTLSKEPIIVDIQCMNSSDGYVIKEFAAKSSDAPTAWITVQPVPTAKPMVQENRYVQHKVHGLSWTEGIIDESVLFMFASGLFTPNRMVFVKGQMKVKVLADRLNINPMFIRSLDEYPNLNRLCEMYEPPVCPIHDHLLRHYACAMKHVEALSSHRNVVEW